MKEKFKILLLIFCVGLLLFPSQSLSAKNLGISCCVVNDNGIECCSTVKGEQKEDPCHDETSDEKNEGCTDCTSCKTCHANVLVMGVTKVEYFNFTKKILPQTQNFKYISPEISSISFKIWQPPKIG